MKDFLHGRPHAANSSDRRVETPIVKTPLPPIGMPHSHPESIDLPDIALDGQAPPEFTSTQGPSTPQVDLIPDSEGRIGHIVITCSCGEKITLQCNY